MIDKVEVGKKYRLIDKEAYLSSHPNNSKILASGIFDDNLCVVINSTRNGHAYHESCSVNSIISPDEYKCFELVKAPAFPVNSWVFSPSGKRVLYIGINSKGAHVFETENGSFVTHDDLSKFRRIPTHVERFMDVLTQIVAEEAHVDNQSAEKTANAIYQAFKSGQLVLPKE